MDGAIGWRVEIDQAEVQQDRQIDEHLGAGHVVAELLNRSVAIYGEQRPKRAHAQHQLGCVAILLGQFHDARNGHWRRNGSRQPALAHRHIGWP